MVEDCAPGSPVHAFARDHARGSRVERHRHDEAQLIVLARGAMRVELDDRVLTVGPGHAAFLPAGLPHAAAYSDHSAIQAVYLDARALAGLPGEATVFPAGALLLALLARALEYVPGAVLLPAEARAMQVLADEIARAPRGAQGLGLGRDARLRRVTEALLADPADRRTLPQWAAAAAVPERTLARLFQRETGQSFARWRMRLQIARAVEWLAAGHPVTQIAYDLGYASPSAFTAMFSREMGAPPQHWLGTRGRAAMPRIETPQPSASARRLPRTI